jgi:hypothetical protein
MRLEKYSTGWLACFHILHNPGHKLRTHPHPAPVSTEGYENPNRNHKKDGDKIVSVLLLLYKAAISCSQAIRDRFIETGKDY